MAKSKVQMKMVEAISIAVIRSGSAAVKGKAEVEAKIKGQNELEEIG